MLRLPASLADQAPVSLGEAVTAVGVGDQCVGLLITAVLHASGRRQAGLSSPVVVWVARNLPAQDPELSQPDPSGDRGEDD